MTKNGKLSLLAASVFLSLTAISAWAIASPVKVTGTVDRNEMGVGDTFTYSLEVSSDQSLNVDEPVFPAIAGLEIINKWSGVESRSTYANGTFEVVQSKNFNYMIAVQKKGVITIPPISVTAEGKSYSTQPIRITVQEGAVQNKQAQRQAQPQDAIDEVEDIFNQLLRRRMGGNGGGIRTQPVNPEEAFFIQVDVDKTRAFVGEQVTATWYLYTRGQIHDIDTLKYPSLGGFWKEEIELATRLNFQQEVVNGVAYQKAILASYALFPIKQGQVTIDPYKAKCTVTVPAGFGFSRPYQFTKASKPISITVSDVPKENRPPDYTGAVGQFTARSWTAQTNVPQQQPVSVKLRFEGRGNAKLLDLPPLNLPAGIELYDTKNEAKFFKEGTSYKEFELVLIPRQTGAVEIPAISMSAFDPQTQKFYSISTQPIKLNVLPGGAQAPSLPLANLEKEKSTPQPQRPSLPPIDLEMSANRMSLPVSKAILWTFVYALIFGLLAWRYVQSADLLMKGRDIGKLTQARLNKINDLVSKGDWRGVGTQGTNLIYLLLGELAGTGGAAEELEKMLLAAPPSVRRELREPVQKLLQVLELLSFAPENLVGAKKDKAELTKVTKELSSFTQRVVKLLKESRELADGVNQKNEA